LSSTSFRDLHNAHWFLSAYRGTAILIRVAKAKVGEGFGNMQSIEHDPKTNATITASKNL
jgi:hypothetical protein